MAISPICAKCGHELTEFGGILLSPPDTDGNVKKLHLCPYCYEQIIKDFPDHKPAAE